MVTGYTIISEMGPLKEEAGMVQGLVARQDKRRVWRSEDNILSFLSLGDNFRAWQVTMLGAQILFYEGVGVKLPHATRRSYQSDQL